MKIITFALIISCLTACEAKAQTDVPYLSKPLEIDGSLDAVLPKDNWKPLFFLMDGSEPNENDFSGEYNLSWREDALYLAVKITDDVLIDKIGPPLERYWDDDALEIFIDENASGGNHQYNFNAFAYHIALDGQAIDIGLPEQSPPHFVALNDHLESVWKRQSDGSVVWEVKLYIYNDRFSLDTPQSPVRLTEGKEMGFMLAYCDNDGAPTRESFVGSYRYPAQNGSLNLGYITADVFEKIKLTKSYMPKNSAGGY